MKKQTNHFSLSFALNLINSYHTLVIIVTETTDTQLEIEIDEVNYEFDREKSLLICTIALFRLSNCWGDVQVLRQHLDNCC